MRPCFALSLRADQLLKNDCSTSSTSTRSCTSHSNSWMSTSSTTSRPEIIIVRLLLFKLSRLASLCLTSAFSALHRSWGRLPVLCLTVQCSGSLSASLEFWSTFCNSLAAITTKFHNARLVYDALVEAFPSGLPELETYALRGQVDVHDYAEE